MQVVPLVIGIMILVVALFTHPIVKDYKPDEVNKKIWILLLLIVMTGIGILLVSTSLFFIIKS